MGTRLADLTTLRLLVQDEGTAVKRHPILNFVGPGVTAAEDISNDRINVTIPGGGGGGGGYDTIQEEGASLAQESVLNFIGAGVTATPGTGKTDVTIPFSRDSNDELENKLINGGNNQVEELLWEDVMNIEGNGDLPIYDSGGSPNLLNIGTPGQVLTVVAGEALWADAAGGSFDPFNDLNDQNSFWWWLDEFFYPTPSSHFPHWETFGAVSTVAINIGGVIQSNTTSVANNVSGFRVCAGGLTAVDTSKHVKLTWRVRPRNSQFNFACRIGLFNGNGSTPGGAFPYGTEDTDSSQRAHCYFGFDDTGNWFTKTITTGGVSQKNFTTVLPTVAAFVNLTIEINRVPSTIEYYIDGVLEVTQTTDLPTGDLAIGTSEQTGNATARGFDIDTMFIVSDR